MLYTNIAVGKKGWGIEVRHQGARTAAGKRLGENAANFLKDLRRKSEGRAVTEQSQRTRSYKQDMMKTGNVITGVMGTYCRALNEKQQDLKKIIIESVMWGLD